MSSLGYPCSVVCPFPLNMTSFPHKSNCIGMFPCSMPSMCLSLDFSLNSSQNYLGLSFNAICIELKGFNAGKWGWLRHYFIICPGLNTKRKT